MHRLVFLIGLVSSLNAGCDETECVTVTEFVDTPLSRPDAPELYERVEMAELSAIFAATEPAQAVGIHGSVVEVSDLSRVDSSYCGDTEPAGFRSNAVVELATEDGTLTLQLPAAVTWETDRAHTSFTFSPGKYLSGDVALSLATPVPEGFRLAGVRCDALNIRTMQFDAWFVPAGCTDANACAPELFESIGSAPITDPERF